MIHEKDKITGFMVFFLITASQVGVGVLGFQSIINKFAGHDAWISVIVAGASISLVIWIIYKMLSWNEKGDIISIHQLTFGKWVGGLLSIIFSLYLLLLAVVVTSTYLEIIQVWMFPHMSMAAILFYLLPLIYYIITGEFRVVTGVCFFGVVYPSILIFTLFYPLQYGHVTNIMPILDHSLTDIVKSSKLAILNFMGFSTLLVYYPFISRQKKTQRFAQYGNLYTTVLYVLICLVSYIYYSQHEIEHVIWATLGLWKIIEMPFLARFEYVGIATLFFSILPNIVLYLWASARTLHRATGIEQKRISVVLLIILFVACLASRDRNMVNLLNDTAAKVGPIFLFIYLPLLFLLYFVRRKVKKNVS